MAKKKSVEAQAIDIAGNAESAEVLTEQPTPSRIATQEQAVALVKSEYSVPENVKVVIVTEDKNVFWQANEGSAVNHAQKQNIKLFRISCQDLVK